MQNGECGMRNFEVSVVANDHTRAFRIPNSAFRIWW